MSKIRWRLLGAILSSMALLPVYGQVKEPLSFENAAEIVCAQYDEDDNLIITGSANGIINLWDPESGRLIRTFGISARLSKNFLAEISPDGKMVGMINGRNGKVWNTKFGDQVCALTGYSDTIKSIHFSSNNKWLVAASLDGTAKLWDVQKGSRQHSLNHMFESLGKREQPYGVTEARFCDGDKSIVTGSGKVSWDSVLRRADTSHVAGKRMYAQTYDSSILIWDMKTGKVIHSLIGYPFEVSPDGTKIVSGSVNTVGFNGRVWDVGTGKILYTLKGHQGEVVSCEFSRDGKLILTASNEGGTCRIWEAATGRSVCYLPVGVGKINTARFSPDGKWIATFAQDTAKIWNVALGKLTHVLPADHPVSFSNSSRHMVILTGNHATVYETISGKPVIIEKRPVGKTSKKVLKIDQ